MSKEFEKFKSEQDELLSEGLLTIIPKTLALKNYRRAQRLGSAIKSKDTNLERKIEILSEQNQAIAEMLAVLLIRKG